MVAVSLKKKKKKEKKKKKKKEKEKKKKKKKEKKKKEKKEIFFFKQKTAYEIGVRLVGSEMCIRDRLWSFSDTHRSIRQYLESVIVRTSASHFYFFDATNVFV